MGQARLTRYLQARSRGQFGAVPAKSLIDAAKETLALGGPDGMDWPELAADIAVESKQAIFVSAQIKEIDERLANLYAEADPERIVASAPGVGPVISAVIAADHARLVDPQLAAKYLRLMSGDRHRNSAVCHLATDLLTRIAACMSTGQPYVIRNVDGRVITEAEGKTIVKEHYRIHQKTRAAAAGRRMRERRRQATGRESQKSQSAPTSRPATPRHKSSPRGLTILRNSVTVSLGTKTVRGPVMPLSARLSA